MYQSTRSKHQVNSLQAVLEGISPDGGLFVDPKLGEKKIDLEKILKKDSRGIVKEVISLVLPDFENVDTLVEKAYEGKFETEDITPVKKVGKDYCIELYRGPTSAFKDFALQLFPQLMSQARKQLGIEEKIAIVTATSGDTGKAALVGFRDVEGIEIFVFYPYKAVSRVQELQMSTQEGNNVHVCAVKGNFDDCQTAVKKAFVELKNAEGVRLSSANSINIGRLAPQIGYYFIAYKKLVEDGAVRIGDPVDFVVPTGNFGDILAGYYAKLIGLPVGRFVCASNTNNVLTDFINTGIYSKNREFFVTTSPSMDILVSSNLERLLFLKSGCNEEQISALMSDLSSKGSYTAPAELMGSIRKDFWGAYATEEEVFAALRRVYNDHNYLCDTHTAVAFDALEKYRKETGSTAPCVVLSTASPYKFSPAVLKAITGEVPAGDEFAAMDALVKLSGVPAPRQLAELQSKTVRFNDVIEREEIGAYIRRNVIL